MTKDPDALRRQIEALQDRVSRLGGALLRISASLDFDTVLREIVDSARALTGARCGVITTVDERGRPQQFLSSGITPDEHRQLADWGDGLRLFEHLRDLPRPLRVRDLAGYVRSLGFSAPVLPCKTLQGTPIRHRGVDVGSLFLTEKEGGREFTSEDEEVLLLFASLAAAAIANARAYRDEQRARANLEALVDTSPVGVVVFDARTGDAVSLNREAKRIVGGLMMPDRSVEQLPEVLTCRRADGREVAFTDFPLAQQLSSAETVRNEEIVLSVPDGRSVRTLLNATPIHAPEGGVESVVVTMQDLAPFEELERMRTELLAIVSHELRTPLTSIKGSTATVLAASPGFAPAEMQQFFRIIDAQADHMSGLIGDLLDTGRIATGTLSVSPEPSEAGVLMDRARNTFLSGGGRATSGGEGQGARFTFTVPVAEEAGGDPAAADSDQGPAGAHRQGREPARILVVDDDPQALLYVRDALTAAGYAALVTAGHRELSRVIQDEKPHLVLLDLMLPGTDGIKLMEDVAELADLPVIFISAYGRDETIARALGAGAVDYIVKPFSQTELTARIRAALRRHAGPEPFVLGELAIDYDRRHVTLAGRPVELTSTEYEVLRVLSATAGRVSTYRSLLRQAWGRYPGYVAPKRVHAVVKRLRGKLGEDAARAAYILNVRGVGYRMPARMPVPREK